MNDKHDKVAMLRAFAYRLMNPDGNHFVGWNVLATKRKTVVTIDMDSEHLRALLARVARVLPEPPPLTVEQRRNLAVIEVLRVYIEGGGTIGIKHEPERGSYLSALPMDAQERTITIKVTARLYDELYPRA